MGRGAGRAKRVTVVASASGRVNLIGEHTDYNGGFVLPVALPLHVRVELEPRDDRVVRARSASIEDGRWQERELDDARTTGAWTDHVLAAGAVLRRMGLIDRGYEVRVVSDVPMGAGLGSSGALGVAMLRALRQAFRIDLDDVALARLAQRGEHEVVGARSGIMDQLSASVGRQGEALFIDCRSRAYEGIPLPDDLELVVVHSGVRHEHAAGAYNERRAQCEEAAARLGVRELRDVEPADLPRVAALPSPFAQRARHVVTENGRVIEAVATLAERDLARLGELLDASHRSLRDDFEVSTAEVDLLVELVREQDGIHGARITGGGFGGSIVAVADAGAGHHAAAVAVAEYEQRTGRDAKIVLPALSL
jgi:galactokinase